MKNGGTYETTEAAEKHPGSSRRIDERAKTSGGGGNNRLSDSLRIDNFSGFSAPKRPPCGLHLETPSPLGGEGRVRGNERKKP
jgi:hypothetical protein